MTFGSRALAYRFAPPVLSGGVLGLVLYLVVRRCRGGNKPVGKGGYARAKSAEDDSLDDDAEEENVVSNLQLCGNNVKTGPKQSQTSLKNKIDKKKIDTKIPTETTRLGGLEEIRIQTAESI